MKDLIDLMGSNLSLSNNCENENSIFQAPIFKTQKPNTFKISMIKPPNPQALLSMMAEKILKPFTPALKIFEKVSGEYVRGQGRQTSPSHCRSFGLVSLFRSFVGVQLVILPIFRSLNGGL
jgi:hypothetical protein